MASPAASTMAAATTRVVGPPFVAKLSSSDCRHSSFFSRRILVFRTTHQPHELEHVIVRATELLVQKFPFLAGQAIISQKPSPTGQSNWKELVPGDGVSITTRDFRTQLSYLELEKDNFPPSSLKHDDLIPLPYRTDSEPYDLAHLQLNFIDGGLLLSVCIAHIAGDGVAQSEILRVFSSYCQVVSDSSSSHADAVGEPAGLDRSCLIGLRGPLNSTLDHPSMIQKHAGMSLKLETHLPSELIKVYRLSAAKLAQLKQDAISDIRISTNDAIMALIWRVIMKSRVAAGVVDAASNPQVTFYFPVSLRRVLGLGNGYVGNAVCNRIVRQPLADLLKESPEALQQTAALIRTEISSVDSDLAKGYGQLSDSAPSVTDFVFGGMSTCKTTSIVVSSLYHSNEKLMQQDWGAALGSRLVRLRCSDAGYAAILGGTNFVMPCAAEDEGAAEVQVSCYAQGVEALENDEGWRRYCEV